MTFNFPDPALQPIVIVDDSDDDIFLLRHGLREGGIANPILTFNSPREAKAFVDVFESRGASPAMVFVDIRLSLSGDQGFDFIAQLREKPKWQKVRIVVVTSSNDPDDLAHAIRLGVDGYLIKFPPAELLSEFVRQGPWFAVAQRAPELLAAH